MNKEQFKEWKEHLITQEIFKALEQTKNMDIESLVEGNTLSADPGETAQLTARIVGKIQGLNQLINISYENEEGEEE